MILTHTLGNISELATDEVQRCHLERVVLPLDALTKRVQRVVSDHGTELGLKLADAQTLHDGDILVRDGDNLIVVAIEASDVLVIAPTSLEQMGVVAHSLGNRHLQAQFFGPSNAAEPHQAFPQIEGLPEHQGVMVIAFDHTAEHYLQHIGVPYLRTSTVMPQPFRHAEHTH